jgi:hypothetical protein
MAGTIGAEVIGIPMAGQNADNVDRIRQAVMRLARTCA